MVIKINSNYYACETERREPACVSELFQNGLPAKLPENAAERAMHVQKSCWRRFRSRVAPISGSACTKVFIYRIIIIGCVFVLRCR